MRWSIPAVPENESEPPSWDLIPAGFIQSWNWHKPAELPLHQFQLAYSADYLHIRFDCLDEEIVADHTEIQSEVWRDNCVELFVSPSSDLSVGYFNFEFSCIGGILVARGHSRAERTRISKADLQEVTIETSLAGPQNVQFDSAQPWWVEAAIPFDLIERYAGVPRPQHGTVWRGNLNACAERIAEPYFVTWAPVGTSQPDFHQPTYFGELVFE